MPSVIQLLSDCSRTPLQALWSPGISSQLLCYTGEGLEVGRKQQREERAGNPILEKSTQFFPPHFSQER